MVNKNRTVRRNTAFLPIAETTHVNNSNLCVDRELITLIEALCCKMEQTLSLSLSVLKFFVAIKDLDVVS